MKDLLVRMVRARVGGQWYAAALLLTPALAILAVALGSALGMPTAVGKEVGLGGVPVLLLISLWLFLLTEESAWRGFALPRLQARMQPVAAALVLGVLLGPVAHPAVPHRRLVPIDDPLRRVPAVHRGDPVLISWIFNHTRGSVLLAALFHATTDVAIAYSGVMSAGADLFWLMVTLQCLAAATVVPSLRTMPANTTGLIHPEPSAQGAPRQTSGASTR